MKYLYSVLLLVTICGVVSAQTSLGTLTIEKIMADPAWIGTSPSGLQWSSGGDTLYFSWNPDKAPADSTYFITLKNRQPQKLSSNRLKEIIYHNTLEYNQARTQAIYQKNGDIFWQDLKSGKTRQLTATAAFESNPVFSFNDKKIVFQQQSDLYGIRQQGNWSNSPVFRNLRRKAAAKKFHPRKNGLKKISWNGCR